MNARMAFPCYNEPDLKASFNLSLIYSSFYNAVHNMETIEDRCVGYKNQKEKNMPEFFKPIFDGTISIGILNDYDETDEAYSDNLIIEDYTNDLFEELTTAVNHTMTLLEDFHDLLGVQYPFKKLKLIVVTEKSRDVFGRIGLLGVLTVTENEERLILYLVQNLLRQTLSDRSSLGSWYDLRIVEGLTWYFSQEVLGDTYSENFDPCWEVSRGTVQNAALAFETDFCVLSPSMLPAVT